jgi:hypothetical protein
MNYEREIHSLAAETLALQAILSSVLDRMSKADANTLQLVKLGFDDATSYVEHVAIKLGRAASPDHATKAIQIVESLRTLTLGNPDKPKHGV